jgi:hypothetical protein
MSGSATTTEGSAPADSTESAPQGTGMEPVSPGGTPLTSDTGTPTAGGSAVTLVSGDPGTPTAGGSVLTTLAVVLEKPVMGGPGTTHSEDINPEQVVTTDAGKDANRWHHWGQSCYG